MSRTPAVTQGPVLIRPGPIHVSVSTVTQATCVTSTLMTVRVSPVRLTIRTVSMVSTLIAVSVNLDFMVFNMV